MEEQPAAAAGGAPTRARRFDVFLSHNSRDKRFVERVAEKLKRTGLEPWLDAWCLVPGVDWQQGLADGLAASEACAVFVGPGDLGAWSNQEVAVALDRAAKDSDFRLFLVLLPGLPDQFESEQLSPFLRMRTWVDYRGGLDDGHAFGGLVSAVQGLPLGPEVPIEPRDDVCPYRGLEFFDEKHADFFFGRDGDIQRLLERFKSTRFLAVLGASGSGKSSLVRAGLVPALRRGAPPGSSEWEIALLRPGAHPIEALSGLLVSLGGGTGMQTTLDALAADARTLHLAASLLLTERASQAEVLFVIDQFEEVFTLCRDEGERRAFFSNLLYAVSVPDGSTKVLVTMRADFYHRCAAYPELAQQLAAQQYLVSPLDRDGLRQAIEEPARRVGLSLEPGLARTIIDDVEKQPGVLPLLEHALLELWKRRRGGMLTLAGYQDSGGVEEAVAKRADDIFGALTESQQELARRTFLRLTQPGEGTEDTRRRAHLAELESTDAHADLDPLLTQLVAARLLITSRDESGDEVVEVAHEALIRGWPRLREWIDEDRAGLRLHRQLTDSSHEWERLKRDESALYRGARLATADEWAGRHHPDLSGLEREFLDASSRAERRGFEAAKRRTRRLRMVAVVLAVLSAISVSAAIIAINKTADARAKQRLFNREARVATSRLLASEQGDVVGRPDLDLLFGLQSLRFADTADSRGALLDALQRRPRLAAIIPGQEGQSHVAFSPDGTLLVSAGRGAVVLWDVARNSRLAKLKNPDLDYSDDTVVGFTHDGRRVWVTQFNGRVFEWDVNDHKLVASSSPGEWTSDDDMPAVSGDGTILAAREKRGGIGFWKVSTGERVRTRLPRDFAPPGSSPWFSSDGRLLLVDEAEKRTVVWKLRTGRRLGALPARVLAVSADGGRALTSLGVVVDLRTFKPVGSPIEGTEFGSWALSPDGRFVAAEQSDGTILLRDVDRDSDVTSVLPQSGGGSLEYAFSGGGRWFATQEEDGQVLLWDVAHPGGLARVLAGPLRLSENPVLSYAPDGRTLAAADDSRVRLWNTGNWTVLRKIRRGKFIGFASDGSLLFADSRRLVYADSAGNTAATLPIRRITDSTWAISGSGRTFARLRGGVLAVWDLADRGLRWRVTPAHPSEITTIAVSGDDSVVATGDKHGHIVLYDRDGNVQARLAPQGREEVTALALDFSGGVVVSTAFDNEVTVWDGARNQLIGTPKTTSNSFIVAFSSRDPLFAVNDGGADDTYLIDSRSGRTVGDLSVEETQRSSDEGSNFPEALAFAPDGRSLALLTSGPTRLVIWNTDVRAWKLRACKLARRNLTQNEWNLYVGPDKPREPACSRPA